MMRLLYISLLLMCLTVSAQDKQLELANNLIFTDPEKSAKISGKVFIESKNYRTKISALSKLVNAQMVLGNIKEVINNCALAIDMSKENNDKINQIRFLSMLGNQYQQLNMNNDAKRNLDEAENLINAIHLPEDLQFIKGNVYNVKGIVFKSELNCEFAINYFDKALEVYHKLPYTDVIKTNKLLVEIQKAFCLSSLGNVEDAEKLYDKILKDNNTELGYNKYFAMAGLADIYLRKKQFTEADRIISSVDVKSFSQYDPELTTFFYSLQARNSYFNNDIKSYLYYLQQYLWTVEQNSKVQNVKIDRLIKNNTQDINTEIKENFIQNILIISVLLVMSFMILSFFRNFLMKKLKS